MKCPDCFGIGEVLIDREGRPVRRLRDAMTMVPCPGCGGSGFTHCCDGLTACNDAREDDDG